MHWLINWLTDWLIGWLMYWLTNFSTSELQKVVRTPPVLEHFDLQISFAPQRRAIFPDQDRNFKNWSDHVVFLRILTYKCGSRHSGVAVSCLCWTATSAPAALASLLFENQEPRTIEKTQRFATFLTFGAMCIFFLVTLLVCWSCF